MFRDKKGRFRRTQPQRVKKTGFYTMLKSVHINFFIKLVLQPSQTPWLFPIPKRFFHVFYPIRFYTRVRLQLNSFLGVGSNRLYTKDKHPKSMYKATQRDHHLNMRTHVGYQHTVNLSLSLFIRLMLQIMCSKIDSCTN